MKNFLTSMLGTLAGLVLFFGASALLVVILIVGLAASATQKKQVGPVEKGSYLVFDLNMNITDAPAPFDSAALFEAFGQGSGGPATVQTRQVIRALREAAGDPAIAGILIEGSLQPSGYGSGPATLREVRAALLEFRNSKKPIMAYMGGADFKDFYLASVATDFVLDPYGAVFIAGLGAQPIFFAGTFEKLGIGTQIVRVGRYKSAVEPYTRKDMSPESREQTSALLNDLWSELRADVAASRELTPEALQAIADKDGIVLAKDAVKLGLVNRLEYQDTILKELKERTGRKGAKESFRQVSLVDYIAKLPAEGPAVQPGAKPTRTDDRVAIVYAEGVIVDGEGKPDEIGGDRFARELRRLREDSSVKAVVLRVNSPGGSATASEHIQRELRLTKEVKPVVVSMGTYAASGGYWISTFGDRIFAEKTTVTGSIGVFGVLFDVAGLSEKIGITVDTVKTAERADLMTPFRPKSPAELAVIQRSVDWIYDEFVGKVAESRGLPATRVREIAEGRVWSGAAALKIGLVDEIGSLDDAVRWASRKAGVAGDLGVEEFPRHKGLEEILTEALERAGQSARVGQSHVLDKLIQKVVIEADRVRQYNDPRALYARLPLEIELP